MKITKSELKGMICEAVKTAIKKQNINEDYDDYDSFEDFAESELPYKCRAKECYMDPEDAGKRNVRIGFNGPDCDLLWTCQDDCSFRDFEKLMAAFGEYYLKETNGKTYDAVMMSRSYPGYGSFINREVTYKDGKPTIKDKKIEPDTFGVRLFLQYEEDDDSFGLYIESADDVSGFEGYGYSNTVKGAKKAFIDELTDVECYLDKPRGYEVDEYTVDIDLNPNFTIDDIFDWMASDSGWTFDNDGTELSDKDEIIKKIKADGVRVAVADGTYSIHWKQKD